MTLFDLVRTVPDTDGPLHLCSLYRKAFKQAELTYPAKYLTVPGAPQWVRGHRLTVGVGSDEDLALAVSAGVRPAQMVVHCDGVGERTIRHAVALRAGQLVVGVPETVATVAAYVEWPQLVLADMTTDRGEDTVTAIATYKPLTLIGLRGRLDPAAIDALVGQMAQIRRDDGVILTRLSLAAVADATELNVVGDATELKEVAAEIDDGLDESSARWRFPRPALVISPLD